MTRNKRLYILYSNNRILGETQIFGLLAAKNLQNDKQVKFLSHSTVNKMVAASSATSTVSMIACCAHHLTDVVPILGLSALSVWLTAYQTPLLIIGILSNLAGSIYMIRIYRRSLNNFSCEGVIKNEVK